jgi:hypothetical protein
LAVCTSTVAADEPPAVAADEPPAVAADEPPAVAGDAEDGGADAEPFVPLLQAAARTPATASGTPNLRASETLLDDSRLFILLCLSFPVEYRALGECRAPIDTPRPQKQFGGCPMFHITE